ncbi:Reticulon-like protein [Quillaja saponaria]|uniref:Reticulon-like protein n=1 Tax=Quillaja saponaria TaxID=32244 RepID=A0AAD7M5T2_QUISA|nr:Reticulon-like protein [Quillaja saponaria]
MSSSSSSDSDSETLSLANLFKHERPIHDILGGGKVADILLWRNRTVSAVLLIGMTAIWFLFEVVDYNLVTLLCHISITTMLVLFIWRTLADIFKWSPPKLPGIIVEDVAFKELASTFHRKFNQSVFMLFDIACGRDLGLFLMTILSLCILSVIGTYFSFLNFLYVGFLCMETLPFVYERNEEEINHLSGNIIREVRRMYRRFDKKFLNKIPRGPVKEKKISNNS